MKYRKKPVVIEATIFEDNVDRIHDISEWMGDMRISYENPKKPQVIIKTLEGTMSADEGDYIIKGVKGEFYPCKPDIFEMTYEKVEEINNKE